MAFCASSTSMLKVWLVAALVAQALELTQGQQSGLTKEHEALAQRLHDADNVMSKYYYDSVNRRTNVFICAKTEEQLHVSRVDDGICDCCDGSDEPNKAWCKSATPCLSYEDKLKRLKAWLKKDSTTNIDSVEGAMFSIREKPHTHQADAAGSDSGDRRVGPATKHAGIKVLKNMNRGDKFLSIPLKLAFTSRVAEESTGEQGKLISMLKPHLTKQAYLSLVLLNEMNRGTESKYYPWISTLPLFVKNIVHTRSVNTFLTAQQPASSLLIDMSNTLLAAVFSAYRMICVELLNKHPELFSKTKYSIGRFIHAYTIVNSRAFSLDLNPHNLQNVNATMQKEIVLVPFADFLNHHHEASFVDSDGKTVEQFKVDSKHGKIDFYLGQDYAKDNEVFLSYGATSAPVTGHITDGGSGSNAHTLHHFAFVNANNPSETVHVSLEYMLRFDQSGCQGVTETGIVEEWRKEALFANDLAHVHYLSFTLDGVMSVEDRKALRLWTVCPGQAVEMGMGAIKKKMQAGEVLEEANEVAVDWMVLLCLEQILMDHHTGVEDDLKLLNENHISKVKQPDYYHTVLYTATVKRILRAGILGVMKLLYETYRRAAANWMDNAEGKVEMGANAGNIENYVKWVEELKTWRTQYLLWKREIRYSNDS